MAAHALPPDCGRLPPLAVFSASNSDMVVGSRVTVMSAPTRASQYGVTDCFTETAEEPFVSFLFDQLMPPLVEAAELRALAAGLSPSVEASTLSWLQSSLLTSMSFSTSSSLAVCAASSATAGSDWSSDGADWASAGNANAVKKPAANSSAL